MKLLAADADKKGSLGWLLHKVNKIIFRKAVDMVFDSMKPVIDYKKREGWINGEMSVFMRAWSTITELDRKKRSHDTGFKGHWSGYTDSNIEMFEKFGWVVMTLLDEDSYYLIRGNMFMELIHDNWPKIENAMDHSRMILKWSNFPEVIRARNEELKKEAGEDG